MSREIDCEFVPPGTEELGVVRFTKEGPINAVLLEQRKQLRLTCKALARLINVSVSYVNQFEGMRVLPTSAVAEKIAQVLGMEKDDIFPSYLQLFIRPKPQAQGIQEIPISQVDRKELEAAGQIYLIQSPASMMMIPEREPEPDLLEVIEEALAHLKGRQQMVLRMRFGLVDGKSRTLEEIGRELRVTPQRIRQIEAKALIKLRRPSISRQLRIYAGKEN